MLCLPIGRLPPCGGEGAARKRQTQFGQIGRGKVAAIVEVVVGGVDGGPVAACASKHVKGIVGVHDLLIWIG